MAWLFDQCPMTCLVIMNMCMMIMAQGLSHKRTVHGEGGERRKCVNTTVFSYSIDFCNIHVDVTFFSKHIFSCNCPSIFLFD